MESEPSGPGFPYVRGQDEIVETLLELCDVDVEPHVVFGTLPEYLFVDPESVGQALQVVSSQWSAPSDMPGQDDDARRLRDAGVIDVVRDGNRPRGWSQPLVTRPGHGQMIGVSRCGRMARRRSTGDAGIVTGRFALWGPKIPHTDVYAPR
jgi:hypothetical protein